MTVGDSFVCSVFFCLPQTLVLCVHSDMRLYQTMNWTVIWQKQPFTLVTVMTGDDVVS